MRDGIEVNELFKFERNVHLEYLGNPNKRVVAHQRRTESSTTAPNSPRPMPRGTQLGETMQDTPTRAQTCGRPQTRRWRELMRAARSDEAEALRLRTELNRYLSSADTQAAQRAARRAARSAAAERRQPTAAGTATAGGGEALPPAAPGGEASIERAKASSIA